VNGCRCWIVFTEIVHSGTGNKVALTSAFVCLLRDESWRKVPCAWRSDALAMTKLGNFFPVLLVSATGSHVPPHLQQCPCRRAANRILKVNRAKPEGLTLRGDQLN
jgi:hypothetical protein